MQPYLIALIICLILAAVIALLFVFAAMCTKSAFGKRRMPNPCLKYFTAEDFGLTASFVALKNGLKGYIYRKEGVNNKNSLIVFCHGMGPGHIAYTTEIACFCSSGYTVLAIDNRGCNLSEGKNLKGMYSGAKTAIAAVDYARSVIKPDKIYLVGHSWGAYSALCACAERNVDGVVAISALVSPVKAFADSSAPVISKPIATILRPFWWIIEFFKFGIKGNSNAAKCAVKSGTPTLLIHGENDKMVPLFYMSAYVNANGSNIEKLLARGKGHNPYNTANAEKLLSELLEKLKKGEKDFTNFDFSAATEEDEEVMRTILQFIENN